MQLSDEEYATLLKDALRYRFLRSEPENFNVEHCSDPAAETWYLTADEDLDAAIDAAIREQK